MAKFHGKLGFVKLEETSPGVHTENATEIPCKGDILRSNFQWENAEQLNANFKIANRFSVIANAFAYENFPYMRYILWNGTKWSIASFEVQSPRVILTIGGVYNG